MTPPPLTMHATALQARPLDRQIRYALGLQYDLNDDITLGCAYEIIDAGLARVDKKGGPFQGRH